MLLTVILLILRRTCIFILPENLIIKRKTFEIDKIIDANVLFKLGLGLRY